MRFQARRCWQTESRRVKLMLEGFAAYTNSLVAGRLGTEFTAVAFASHSYPYPSIYHPCFAKSLIKLHGKHVVVG